MDRHLGSGHWLIARDGGVFTFGHATFAGSAANQRAGRRFTGAAATARDGYWVVREDGAVYPFGSASTTFGPASVIRGLRAPIVGIATTPDRRGYWLVAGDGGVFTFGNADFHGSGTDVACGRTASCGPPPPPPHGVVAIAARPDGAGYWTVTRDGRVYNYGFAGHHGDMSHHQLTAPVVQILTTRSGEGYWLVAADGGVFSFGDAPFLGSLGGTPLNAPIVGANT